MLHNSGPYGASEPSLNAIQPMNLQQMTTPLNFGQNINNVAGFAQTPVKMNRGSYVPSDRSDFCPTSTNVSSQTTNFDHYSSVNLQGILHEDSQSPGKILWQSNFEHTSDNPYTNQNQSTSASCFNSRSTDDQITDLANDKDCNQIPLDLHQGPETVSREDNDIQSKDLFNANCDKFNNFNQKNVFHIESVARPLLDNTKRKSLEHTVKLIEDMLVNTTKNQLKKKQKAATAKRKRKKNDQKAVEPTEKTPSKSSTAKIEEKSTTKNNNEAINEINIDKNDTDTKLPKGQLETEIVTVPNKTENDLNFECNINIVKEDSDPLEGENLVFTKDINGIMKEYLGNDNIVIYENSYDKAKTAITSGLKNIYYECPYCNHCFSHPKRFLIHYKWHNFGLTNKKRMQIEKEKEMKRNQRKEERVVEKILVNEVKGTGSRRKNAEKTFSCEDCDKLFISKGSLKNHRYKIHPSRMRQCKVCDLQLPDWSSFRAHSATHTAEGNPYKCIECSKLFRYPQSLTKHRLTHLEKTLTCPQCPKKFGSEVQIKIHMKTHERAEKGASYHCSFCSKSFYEAYSLNVHERTHKNERPFLCEICNATFCTNSGLKRHKKVSHNSSKPFTCNTCHRSFCTENIRDRHAARAHGELDSFNFHCELCGSRYLKSLDLRKHMYKVHKQKRRSDKDAAIENSSS